MSFFANKIDPKAADRLLEEKIYEMVAEEIQKGIRKDGIWLKAFSEAQGDEVRARAIYVSLRAQSIKDEIQVTSVIQAEEAKINQRRKAEQFKTISQEIDYLIDMVEKNAPLQNIQDRLSLFTHEEKVEILNSLNTLDQLILNQAIRKGRLDIVKFLIIQGAKISTKDYWGSNALDLAKKLENKEIYDYLSSFN